LLFTNNPPLQESKGAWILGRGESCLIFWGGIGRATFPLHPSSSKLPPSPYPKGDGGKGVLLTPHPEGESCLPKATFPLPSPSGGKATFPFGVRGRQHPLPLQESHYKGVGEGRTGVKGGSEGCEGNNCINI